MDVTAFQVASRFFGIHEVAGAVHNPIIVAMLSLDNKWAVEDEIPWCSAFINFICFILGIPRSHSLAARSWVTIGSEIPLSEAKPGFTIVVLKRGTNPSQGHVAFYASQDENEVILLGGNQGNSVSLSRFKKSDVIAVRKLQ
jgi:uncharacterized protein (TIGR02594 family)